jgi:hypothetical protein
MVLASNFSDIDVHVKEILNEYQKHNYTNKNIANIRNVASRFEWWKELTTTVKDTIIDAVHKKL